MIHGEIVAGGIGGGLPCRLERGDDAEGDRDQAGGVSQPWPPFRRGVEVFAPAPRRETRWQGWNREAPSTDRTRLIREELQWKARMKRRILIVDDTPLIREHLRVILEMDDYEVQTASDGRSALEAVREQVFHLMVTDLRMPDMSGIELLTAVRAERLPFGVIVLTGHADTQVALDVMKSGADDFVTKPCDPDHLRFVVQRVLERRRLIDELEQLRKQMRADYSFHNMVSKSPKMRRIFDLIEQVGPLGSTALIYGETGTGKEVVAQAIPAADSLRKGPVVALTCAILHASLRESELFGHERGAFTGADRRQKGRFEGADGGTLFLVEVGDVSPAMQAKLL